MLKQSLNSFLGKFGYRITKLAKEAIDPSDRFFSTWAKFGTPPGFIIDIGANHGGWTRRALRQFSEASVLMIEPQERLRVYSEDLLAGRNVTWKTAGIADKVGQMTLSLPPRDDSASFLISEETARSQGFRRIDVPVTTIDTLVSEARQIPNMIKIDAEGFDLKALKAANSILGKTEVILVECAVACQGLENTLDNILPLMWNKGYKVFDITDLNHSPSSGALWLTELVFVLHSSSIWERLKSY